MNENIQLQMNPSVKKQRSIGTSIELFSQDIDNYSFDITFTDLELQAGDQVEVLAKLHGGKLEHKSSANLVEVDGELIARYVFDTKLIDSEGHVFCYVYLKRDGKSADVGAFYFEVDLSELDKVGGKIAEVYDGRYEDLVAEFEVKLQAYRDSLPQASEVRADIDVLLNKFGMDGQAKLNQYDADAQQVIADNQTAFGLAESGRQNTYEQAEDSRNQVSEQAVVDWNMTADALLETVEDNETARVDAEATRKTAETDRVSSESTRKTNETTRISNEDTRKSAEVIRLANEVDRVNAEDVRAEFYEGFDGRLGDLEDRQMALKNEVINGDFSTNYVNHTSPTSHFSTEIVDGVLVLSPLSYLTVRYLEFPFQQNIGEKFYLNFTVDMPAENYVDWRVGNVPTRTYVSVGENTLSHAITVTRNQSTTYMYFDTTSMLGLLIKLDDVMAINLTRTFGAGNEPTKSEMDELIKITGYFDEISLTQKQMLNWQLKLMRQNRNALIALGGTII